MFRAALVKAKADQASAVEEQGSATTRSVLSPRSVAPSVGAMSLGLKSGLSLKSGGVGVSFATDAPLSPNTNTAGGGKHIDVAVLEKENERLRVQMAQLQAQLTGVQVKHTVSHRIEINYW